MKNLEIEQTCSTISILFAGAAWLETTELVLRIIASILSVVFAVVTLILSLRAWYKKASKDGKITKAEWEEGIKTAQDGITKVSSEIDKTKETLDNKDKEKKQ